MELSDGQKASPNMCTLYEVYLETDGWHVSRISEIVCKSND